jgi:hypothetical protein
VGRHDEPPVRRGVVHGCAVSGGGDKLTRVGVASCPAHVLSVTARVCSDVFFFCPQLRRNRGYVHCGPCCRIVHGSDQDRRAVSFRAAGEVQPAAAHRGGARRRCQVRRQVLPHARPAVFQVDLSRECESPHTHQPLRLCLPATALLPPPGTRTDPFGLVTTVPQFANARRARVPTAIACRYNHAHVLQYATRQAL